MIIAYTDGACKGNGKTLSPVGGWGYFFYDESDPDTVIREDYGGKNPTTNNEMELTALLKLLENLPEKPCEIRVDSMYVMNIFVNKETPDVMNSGWVDGWIKTGRIDVNIANSALVKKIHALLKLRKVQTRFVWVKAHSKEKGNEYVDGLANRGVVELSGFQKESPESRPVSSKKSKNDIQEESLSKVMEPKVQSKHCQQRVAFEIDPKLFPPEPVPLAQLKRKRDQNDPRMAYQKTDPKLRSVNHWGQRKLMLSEIEFLTQELGPNPVQSIVVYAGAAPGKHIFELAEMFPCVTFYLFDPSDFDQKIKTHPRIKTFQEFFDKDTISRFKNANKDIFFISDIRTGDPKVKGGEELEADILNDMNMQQEWVVELKPKAAMLKFRLPWSEGKTRYLKGEIMYPVWGPETTTESRLIVKSPFSYRMYDNKRYESQMFHFNMVTRVTEYEVPEEMKETGSMDGCYDCASEIKILQTFLDTYRVNLSLTELSKKVSDACSDKRTLKTKIDQKQRKGWFPGKVYDPKKGKVFVQKPS